MLWDRIQFCEHVNPETVGRPSVFIPFGGLGAGRLREQPTDDATLLDTYLTLHGPELNDDATLC